MVGPLQRWEYRIEQSPSSEMLSQLGADGWELTGIEGGSCVLKRPALSFVERVTLEQRACYYESLGLNPEPPESAE